MHIYSLFYNFLWLFLVKHTNVGENILSNLKWEYENVPMVLLSAVQTATSYKEASYSRFFLFILQWNFLLAIKLQLLFLTFFSIYFYFMFISLFFKVSSHILASRLIFFDTLNFLQLYVNVLVFHGLVFVSGRPQRGLLWEAVGSFHQVQQSQSLMALKMDMLLAQLERYVTPLW